MTIKLAEKLEGIFEQLAQDSEFQKTVAGLNMNFKYLDSNAYEEALKAEDSLYKGIIQDNKLGDLNK